MECGRCGHVVRFQHLHGCTYPGTVKRGLEPILGALGGFFVTFGSPNTPLDEGRTRRFSGDGLVEQNALFQPLAGVATITNPTHEREASITGKPGGQRMYARVSHPAVDSTPMLDLTPRVGGPMTRIITRAQVDPWKSTVGKTSWTPGAMAQEAVSG